MDGLVMWIVLGVLIVVVIAFLIFSSIKDKKNAKKRKAEKDEYVKASEEAGYLIAIWLIEFRAITKKALDDFVPSVGKVKMGELKTKARLTIDSFENSKTFVIGKQNDKNIKLIEAFRVLKRTSITRWETECTKEWKLITKIYNKRDEVSSVEDFIQRVKEKLSGVYDV